MSTNLRSHSLTNPFPPPKNRYGNTHHRITQSLASPALRSCCTSGLFFRILLFILGEPGAVSRGRNEVNRAKLEVTKVFKFRGSDFCRVYFVSPRLTARDAWTSVISRDTEAGIDRILLFLISHRSLRAPGLFFVEDWERQIPGASDRQRITK